MQLPIRIAASALCLAAFGGVCGGQEWTETSVVQKFVEQNPYAREARARVAIARAEARGRTLYSNPAFHYSRESAGLTEFFQAEQTIPLSGRLRLLREAGESAIRAAEADGAFDLWQARTALRSAFFQLLAAQQRESIYLDGIQEIEKVIQVLQVREREGEGSRFDRLRTERERAEMLAELELLRADVEIERARLQAFLPPDANITRVTGRLDEPGLVLDAAALLDRALTARADFRAEQRRLEQFRAEQQAAVRLKIPEPALNVGLKRAEVAPNRIAHGPVIGISVPLPLFNKGQTEVARFSAEQERVAARMRKLSQRIRAEIEGVARAFAVRVQARDRYQSQLSSSGPELVRIAITAYQEGEIGILQLLDAYRTQRQSRIRMLEIQAAVKEARIELERVIGEEFGK